MAEGIALLQLKDVKLRVGLSTATIYRMMAKGKFPKSRKLAHGCSRCGMEHKHGAKHGARY